MGATGIELEVDVVASRALEELKHRTQVWVVGEGGSGRHTLAYRLADAIGASASIIDLLDADEADAAISGFYSAAAWLPTRGARASSFRDWRSLHEAMASLHHAGGRDLTLIVIVPQSWERPGAADDDWSQQAYRRSLQLLHGIADSALRVVWMTSRTMTPEQLGNESLPQPIPLRRPRNTTAILESIDWGPYQSCATALAKRLPAGSEPSPVALRLAVGLAAIGTDIERVASCFSRSTGETLRSLLTDFVDQLLNRNELFDCKSAVGRLLLARRPLPPETALEVTGVPRDHAPLIQHCIAYGDELLRMSPAVRSGLRPLRARDSDAKRTHEKLAAHFQRLDGAPAVTATSGHSTIAWLEKHHHLAHSATRHEEIDLPCRELYWARGRHLSVVERDYAEAAKVYEACVAKFEDDAYAWHYLAWNLERAGRARKTATAAYVRAIENDRPNPWWNGRYVTFLLAQGDTDRALSAWAEALDNVDPEGERVQHDVWLSRHMHYWVARAWLEVGDVSQAVAVLRSIPDAIFARSPELCDLKQQVLDAVEADALGEAVYPRSFDVARRWTEPMFLPKEVQGKRLSTWFPGRITSATEERVRVVYGSRPLPGKYETNVVDIRAKDWQVWGFGSPADAAGFVELGHYAGGVRKIVPFECAEPPRATDLPLAYFDRWRRAK